jgi:chemosensory pili system protein ChpA (sensor histidine kinase/response regulator)
MNAPTDFDIGPLTWVKSEIDLALERADKALQQFTASAADGSRRSDADPVLPHPSAPGAGRSDHRRTGRCHPVCRSAGVLLEAIELQERRAATPATVELAQRAMAALRHYLDDLISGQPNQPLAAPAAVPRSAVGTRAGTCLRDRSLLPRPAASATPRGPGAETSAVASLHAAPASASAHFQRGLLSWLRAPKGAGRGRKCSTPSNASSHPGTALGARAFWWVATAFLTALAEHSACRRMPMPDNCAAASTCRFADCSKARATSPSA